VIPVAIFETIRHWRCSVLSRWKIARRLNIDVKTVRRTLRKIDGAATAPAGSRRASKPKVLNRLVSSCIEKSCPVRVSASRSYRSVTPGIACFSLVWQPNGNRTIEHEE
jgi:transposase